MTDEELQKLAEKEYPFNPSFEGWPANITIEGLAKHARGAFVAGYKASLGRKEVDERLQIHIGKMWEAFGNFCKEMNRLEPTINTK